MVIATTKILTLANGYHLWSQKQGKGTTQLLCLHGGPGSDHEIFEEFGNHLADQDISVYMYDQLGSWYSDMPDFSVSKNRNKFFKIDYYVYEIEEVRQLLGLDNFFLLGHSWGGILAQEYALKYGDSKGFRGLIISDMTDDIASYERNIAHERKELLGSEEVMFMRQCESKGEYTNNRYHQDVLKLDYTYIIKHPEHSSKHLIGTKNRALYEYFQGANEFVVTGALSGWTVADRLYQIKQPTAIIFGSDDTMDKDEGQKMSKRLPNGEFHIINNAGHCSMLDNPKEYFSVLTKFVKRNS